MYKATKTLQAIEEQILSDQGEKYRKYLRWNIMNAEDAFKTDKIPFRNHLGASVIGKKCARAIWYSYRWCKLPEIEGRVLRLFNRGHLEEARFISALECIEVTVHSKQTNGKQFKFPLHNEHFGCSLDGVAVGLPELSAGTAALNEYKTCNDKSFLDVSKNGVQESKPEHYIQMNIGMRLANLPVALYLAVNKNNDELHGEYIALDTSIADQYCERAEKIIWLEQPPPRISESPGWFECKWCDHYNICHQKAPIHKNCRSCKYAEPSQDESYAGCWFCKRTGQVIENGSIGSNEGPLFTTCEHYDPAA
jgi:hypothetical protein